MIYFTKDLADLTSSYFMLYLGPIWLSMWEGCSNKSDWVLSGRMPRIESGPRGSSYKWKFLGASGQPG